MNIMLGPHKFSLHSFFSVCCSGVECHNLVSYIINITSDVLFHHNDKYCDWDVYVMAIPFEPQI